MKTETLRPRIETTQQEHQFAVSMAAMLGPRTAYLAFMPVGLYAKIASDAGLMLDFWPIRPTPSLQVAMDILSRTDKEAIVSVSGSFRGEKNIIESLAHPNRAMATAAYLILPHRDNLYIVNQVTRQVRLATERKIPVVQYPESPLEARKKILTPRLIQPTPEEFIKNNLQRAEDLDRYLQDNGFCGFCFDTLHSRFLFTDTSFKHLFQDVIARTKLVHLSLGRVDITRPNYPVDGLKDFGDIVYYSPRSLSENSEIVQLLRAISDLGFLGTWVFETPAAVGQEVFGKVPITPKQLSLFYQLLKSSVCEVLGGVRA